MQTTDLYWDCECTEHFIHPKDCPKCKICGAVREDQPDSRVPEVVAALSPGQREPNKLLHLCPITTVQS